MATGRTVSKFTQVFIDGFDMSGFARSIGPLVVDYGGTQEAALSDAIKNVSGGLDQPSVMVGTLDTFLDNTATVGTHVNLATPGTLHRVTVAIGIQAAAAAGDPAFAGEWVENSYIAEVTGGTLAVTADFGEAHNLAASFDYGQGWGHVIDPGTTARTAVNGGTSDHDNGASSALGGFAVLQGLAGNGTATVSLEHSAVDADGNFDSTGDILAFAETDFSTPFAAIAVVATPATTVQRYVRWQVSLNGASTLRFNLMFIRGK